MRIAELAEKIRSGEVDVVEHTQKALDEAKSLSNENFYMNAICESRALKRAEELKKNKPKGRLAGVPIAIKDSIVVKGVESTAGSRILKGYVPVFNSTCVQKAEDEGAIVIGKTSQDEFGFGTFSTNVGIGHKIPLNPFDRMHVCGGSSGGSAGMARKAGFACLMYGESTGGSIVNPASFCGVFGLCPTYGRVSRYGLIDFANSLDKVGPMSKYIGDIALGLEVMSGYDPQDSTSANTPVDKYSSYMGKSLNGVKIGVIKEGLGEGISQEVAEAIRAGISRMEAEGASVEKVSTPLAIDYGLAVYYIIATSEASTNLAKFCGMRYGVEAEPNGDFNEYFSRIRSENLGKEAKRRIMLGTFARMAGFRDAYYLKAAKIRTKIIAEYKSLFRKYDLLVSPAVPYLPPKINEVSKLTPLQCYMADLLTVSPNLAGLPHLNIPVGMKRGLPVGMMAIADHFSEGKLIQAGSLFDEK